MKEPIKDLSAFLQAIEQMPICILLYDPDKEKILHCNSWMIQQLKYRDNDHFLQEGPFSETPSCQQAFSNFREVVEKVTKAPGRTTSLSIRQTDTPSLLYTEVKGDTISIGGKEYLLFTFLDATKGKDTEDQLQDSQNTLEAIIKTAVDGIIIIDERGIIQMANEAAESLFGYSVDEMMNQNVSMLMPEPHHSQHDEYISNYQRTGVGQIIGIGREVSGKRKDGTLFPLRLAVSKVETEQRRLFVGVIHDLTDQKAAEAKILQLNNKLEQMVEARTEELSEVVNRLLQSNIKLEQEIKEKQAAEEALLKNEEELKEALEKEKELNELKSRFVSMASHEFRTPLTTIASSTDLLGLYKATEQQPKREKHIKRIQSAVANLTGVLGDFLSLSKLEEGKIQSHPVAFNLQELLEEAVEDMASLLKPGQKIAPSFVNTDQTISLDKKLLKNVFINLLSNAIKYSDKDTTIWLEVVLEDKLIRAAIKDEGIGIPEEDQKHLFSRFFRAENAINIQGTGLGLNIVKRYLDLMKGYIEFESRQGIGTTFYFKIPV
jgi:PAS domain S-box-containing protein